MTQVLWGAQILASLAAGSFVVERLDPSKGKTVSTSYFADGSGTPGLTAPGHPFSVLNEGALTAPGVYLAHVMAHEYLHQLGLTHPENNPAATTRFNCTVFSIVPGSIGSQWGFPAC